MLFWLVALTILTTAVNFQHLDPKFQTVLRLQDYNTLYYTFNNAVSTASKFKYFSKSVAYTQVVGRRELLYTSKCSKRFPFRCGKLYTSDHWKKVTKYRKFIRLKFVIQTSRRQGVNIFPNIPAILARRNHYQYQWNHRVSTLKVPSQKTETSYRVRNEGQVEHSLKPRTHKIRGWKYFCLKETDVFHTFLRLIADSFLGTSPQQAPCCKTETTRRRVATCRPDLELLNWVHRVHCMPNKYKEM
jgi:hypothetical protein